MLIKISTKKTKTSPSEVILINKEDISTVSDVDYQTTEEGIYCFCIAITFRSNRYTTILFDYSKHHLKRVVDLLSDGKIEREEEKEKTLLDKVTEAQVKVLINKQ